MWPFKRKFVPAHVCLHEWHFVDTRLDYVNACVGIDVEDLYTIACVKCGRKRELDRFEFAHFRKYFNVKLPEVSADGAA